MDETVKKNIEDLAAKYINGKTLTHCIKYPKDGAPMIYIAFKDGSKNKIKLKTEESRDYLYHQIREQAGWNLKRSLKSTA